VPSEYILLEAGKDTIGRTKAGIIVPAHTGDGSGSITALAVGQGDAAKHALHSLCQIASLDLEDGELEIERMEQGYPIAMIFKRQRFECRNGSLVFLNTSGTVHVLSHSGVNVRDAIRQAFRYCTRFIRLDVP